MKPTSSQIGIVVAVASAMVCGIYPATTRAVYADGGNAMFMIIVTIWARALLPTFYCLAKNKALFHTPLARKQSLTGGFFQAISSLCVFAALRFLPGPLVIILFYTHTLMLLFFMAARGEAKIDKATMGSTIAALFGLSLVLDIWHKQGSASLTGMALAFTAALVAVTRLYIYGKQMQERDPPIVGAETFFVAAILTSLVCIIVPPQAPVSLEGYGYAAFGSISLALGTFGMFYGIALLGAFKWSLFLKLEPVFTAFFSFLLLGEVLKATQYLGIVVVLGSLAAYQIMGHRSAAASVSLASALADDYTD